MPCPIPKCITLFALTNRWAVPGVPRPAVHRDWLSQGVLDDMTTTTANAAPIVFVVDDDVSVRESLELLSQ